MDEQLIAAIAAKNLQRVEELLAARFPQKFSISFG